MSIPPLVCSTPPPPDQCEDEKDPVDFDLQYSLSQDDDENNDYDYGNFSTYSHFQSSILEKEKVGPPLSANSSEIEIENKMFEKTNDNSETIVEDNKSDILSKIEEDVNIEDLNLKVDELSLDSTKRNHDTGDCVTETNTHILDIPTDTNDNVPAIDHIDEPKNVNIKNEMSDDETNVVSINTLESNIIPSTLEKKSDVASGTHAKIIRQVLNESENVIDDDFEDFVQSDIINPKKTTEESITKSENMADSNSQDLGICDSHEIKEIESVDVLKNVTENNSSEFLENRHDVTNDNSISELKNVTNKDFEDFTKHKEGEPVKKLENVTDNNFEDFDNFHFNADAKPTTIINNFDNPWDNDKTSDPEFEEFKANFTDNDAIFVTATSISDERDNINQCQNEIDPNIDEEDDDFGEFDDFKSSTIETKESDVETESISFHQVPVLNLQSSDNESQVIESINQVLSSIFQHEISKPNNEYEVKLESLLCETWGHLIEIDVRQPYIVNWNNSLGQKTLLKALCIDSRNILFGPRWSYNMPKYAANLSAAPLQPQKHSSSNITQNEAINPEKPANKSSDTWTDPFTSDGQEFTYAEALLLDLEHLMATLDQMAHNHSTLKISELLSHACNTNSGNAVTVTRPTNLDIFDADTSPKPDKIFSNTISVQPIRQINLPDTHIFTPTNSETPRSKTIHYDNIPTVIMPQSVVENNQNMEKAVQPVDDIGNPENDNEYSDFQDFQGTFEHSSTASANQQSLDQPIENPTPKNSTVPNADITIQTQILQPIKVEPIMPSLNWPDPGEVKEVFDDFTDFISNSSWNKEKQDTTHIPVTQTDTSSSSVDSESNVRNTNVNDITTHVEESFKINDNIDDEFDTFQSAFPSTSNVVPLENVNNFTNTNFSTHIENNTPPIPSSNLDFAYPHSDGIKTDPISFTHATNSNDILTKTSMSFVSNGLNNISKPAETSSLQSSEIQKINTYILRPTTVNTSMTQYQQNTVQILQPLSLESYSQINWPNPGIDLQDLSRFNPIESLQSLKNDTSGPSKVASPIHNAKNQIPDDDIWGEFVSSKPKQQVPAKKATTFNDDDEWTDFVSSPSTKSQNGLNTISLNVHTNLHMQKSSNQNKFMMGNKQISLDIPTLNYITPKSNNHKSYNDKHFQNL